MNSWSGWAQTWQGWGDGAEPPAVAPVLDALIFEELLRGAQQPFGVVFPPDGKPADQIEPSRKKKKKKRKAEQAAAAAAAKPPMTPQQVDLLAALLAHAAAATAKAEKLKRTQRNALAALLCS